MKTKDLENAITLGIRRGSDGLILDDISLSAAQRVNWPGGSEPVVDFLIDVVLDYLEFEDGRVVISGERGDVEGVVHALRFHARILNEAADAIERSFLAAPN